MSPASTSRIGWASVTPALLWTLVFFVVPFIAMGVMAVMSTTALSIALAFCVASPKPTLMVILLSLGTCMGFL